MGFFIDVILVSFVIVPVIIALVRYSQINNAYYPFIYCLWLGMINESLSYFLVKAGFYNTVNSNIYMLLESFLLVWQFRRWGLFQQKIHFALVLGLLLLIWVAENLIIFNITHYGSYFLMIYSFFLSLLSIRVINKIMTTERKRLMKNSTFLICIAFVIFYTFSVLSEAFWVYGIVESGELASKIHGIAVVTNFIALIFYSFAILWMPTRQKFTLPSSSQP